jgi:nitronate monooxygenase
VFRTRITELLNIEHPIIAGPMAFLSEAELVSAVSNAGGLGILSSTAIPTVQDIRQEIRKTRDLTDKPFAVNVTLFYQPRESTFEDLFTAIIEEGVRIVETSGRNPEPYMKMLKDAGVKIMHRATRTIDIKRAEQLGVDAVTILGIEAAGRPGVENVTSMVRIPAAASSVKVPVVAAGGIASGRGLAAALVLGAEGVLMGTRFLLSKDCRANPKLKNQLLQLKEADTILMQQGTPNSARIARMEYGLMLHEMERKGATPEELQAMTGGNRRRDAYVTGDTNQSTFSIGQSVGLIEDIPSVKEIIDGIVNEAEDIVGDLKHKITT